MNSYPEIQALQQIYDDHTIEIRVTKDLYLREKEHTKVTFVLNNLAFELYIDDEYNDLSIGNPLLSLCLVLRELETYNEEEDIVTWSISKGIDPGNPMVLNYYKNLSKIYTQIEQELGKIDSHISDLDFQLNAGPAQVLRNCHSDRTQ